MISKGAALVAATCFAVGAAGACSSSPADGATATSSSTISSGATSSGTGGATSTASASSGSGGAGGGVDCKSGSGGGAGGSANDKCMTCCENAYPNEFSALQDAVLAACGCTANAACSAECAAGCADKTKIMDGDACSLCLNQQGSTQSSCAVVAAEKCDGDPKCAAAVECILGQCG